MAKKNTSIEEQIEDWCKKQFKGEKYYTKTEAVNSEIENALEKAPSKQGGSGKNYPDVKFILISDNGRKIPVMIEVKGKKGDLIKTNDKGEVENTKKNSEPNYQNIAKYAVNGAVHYANAILEYAESYKEVLAIGVNGYEDTGKTVYEVDVWYISKENLFVPKHVGGYEDISFLLGNNAKEFVKKIDTLSLTPEELEERKLALEDEIERKLKALNQSLHDEKQIVVNNRVQLVAGLIMAGLGAEGVPPLRVEDLAGREDDENNDGQVIMSKIRMYLAHKNLPEEKIEMITDILKVVFIQSNLQVPINGESKLHTIYADVKRDILPYVTGELHNIDFTGRLFNVMNEWVAVPDGGENDVVLTPSYVATLLVKLARVDKDSYVWDFATGSAGLLVAAMNEMLIDAKNNINSPEELSKKQAKIKAEQLLGIELLPSVYMLAILNMILMGDGSSNILNKNSLTDFDGKYGFGKTDEKFPANAFILNPPYSASGNGMCFVEKALGMMNRGYAAIIIKNSAGSGNAIEYNKRILEKHTLLASIKMPIDLFMGKASVQTHVYVFRINEKHRDDDIVKFIDFSNDGYVRSDRKKASCNLRDTDNAKERYEEVVNLVRFGKNKLCYLTDKEYYEGTINPKNGADWNQSTPVDTKPTLADFKRTVADYLSWEVSNLIKTQKTEEDCLGK